jgi:cysteine-rich repeat protein
MVVMKPVRMSLALLVVGVGVGSFACGDPIEANDEIGDSETGDGDSGDGDGDSGDGDGEPGDGDGEPGDGDGEPGDGDGDGSSVCGNGEVEADEECDDGNDVDEDGCTNACALPVCGDGIVTETLGEVCDDGNNASGDGCTSTCVLPGAVIAAAVIDIGSQTEDLGHEVVIDSGDNIAILLETNGAMRLVETNPDLMLEWNYAALQVLTPNLAIGPDDELIIGGRLNTQGSTRKYASNGNLLWTRNVPAANSWILSVGVDAQGEVYSAGSQPDGGDQSGLLLHYDAMGTTDWTVLQDQAESYGPIAVDANGQSWVVRRTPRQLDNFGPDGSPGWTQALPNADYHELAVDPDGNIYLLASAANASMFSLHKFDEGGALLWTAEHDDPDVLDTATGLTLLPGGAILVAGFTNGSPTESDGLLVWYAPDGGVLHQLVIDGEGDDDRDFFYDFAVGPGGDYAVAVGGRLESGSDNDLWIFKFEI